MACISASLRVTLRLAESVKVSVSVDPAAAEAVPEPWRGADLPQRGAPQARPQVALEAGEGRL